MPVASIAGQASILRPDVISVLPAHPRARESCFWAFLQKIHLWEASSPLVQVGVLCVDKFIPLDLEIIIFSPFQSLTEAVSLSVNPVTAIIPIHLFN